MRPNSFRYSQKKIVLLICQGKERKTQRTVVREVAFQDIQIFFRSRPMKISTEENSFIILKVRLSRI